MSTTTRHLTPVPATPSPGPAAVHPGSAAHYPAPGPMLETLLAQAGNEGATKALGAVADLVDWLAVVVDGNATALSTHTPDRLAAAQYRRDARLYRRLAALLRQPLTDPTNWYDQLVSAFDGRFTAESLTE